MDEARVINSVIKEGEQVALEASKKATEQMMKIGSKLGTPEARVEAMKAHALYMGVGTMFMETLVPILSNVKQDLQDRSGLSENEAHMMQGIYIGKVFKLIIEGVREHE